MPNAAAVSRVIAAEFLQTVVIVDDRADLKFSESPAPGAAESPAMSDEGVDEGKSQGAGSHVETSSADAIPEPGLTAPSDAELSVAEHGDLDAKTIIDRFAALGLVCGVIRPEKSEDIAAVVDPAAIRADILVLDWWMHGDGGAKSKEIIADVALLDEQQNRIRLIIVYTAVPDLARIAAEIASILDGAKVQDRNRVVAGSIHVVVLAKPETDVDSFLAGEVVSFGDFPDRVISEFASVVEGLLSNVAFAALAAIRNNTHRVLTRFDRDLDPAYLGHRMLLSRPEDAERHLIELILQELAAVLDSSEVGQWAGYDAVRQLVEDSVLVVEAVPNLVVSAARQGLQLGVLAMHLVREGIESPTYRLSKEERKGVLEWISKVFAQTKTKSADADDAIDEQWSWLMSNKIQYGTTCPELRLGTLVREKGSKQFMLCMQPVCDSVRLASNTVFPFLPLEEAAPGKSDIALKYEDKYYCLKLRYKFKNLADLLQAAPDSSGVVKAERSSDDEAWAFVPAGEEPVPLEWVGDLRDNFAHKFANMFAESVSRVGVDESEWFRRPR